MFEDLNPPEPYRRADDRPDVKKKRKKAPGLGDRVEQVAKPIAKVIDLVAGTDLKNCGGCQKRKEYLNRKFPGK